MRYKEENFDVQKAIKAQSVFCIENKYPHFAPKNGICWCCGNNIYELIGWKSYARKNKVSLKEAVFVTGISTEKASKELITYCPHCNRSYC